MRYVLVIIWHLFPITWILGAMWMITPLQARRRPVDNHVRHQDAALESQASPSHTSTPLTTTTAGEARLHDQRSTRQVHAPLRLRGGHQVTLEQLLKSPRTGASPRPSTWRPPTEKGSSRRARSSPLTLHPRGMRRPQAEPPPAHSSCDRPRLEMRRRGIPLPSAESSYIIATLLAPPRPQSPVPPASRPTQ